MIKILFPVGRMVEGSPIRQYTKDFKTGEPLTTPYYFCAVAIPKDGRHWQQTEWGAKIVEVAMKKYVNGETQSPNFAWKIVDGDSMIPNSKQKKPCDKEGFRGCWIVNFRTNFAIEISKDKGKTVLIRDEEKESYMKLGYFIEVFCDVKDNSPSQSPGVYLNFTHVCFSGYGDVISSQIASSEVGFGNSALPAGASVTPPSGFIPPVAPVNQFVPPTMPPHTHNVVPSPIHGIGSALPPAYPAILNTGVPSPQNFAPPPPAPVAPQKTMLPAANGMPYEQWIAAGWTDEMLIQMGKMLKLEI